MSFISPCFSYRVLFNRLTIAALLLLPFGSKLLAQNYCYTSTNGWATGFYLGADMIGCSSGGVTTFNYTGGYQSYTVPAGVSSITITAAGAQGGAYATSDPGGLGAVETGTFAVTPGQVLTILVGGSPSQSCGCLPGGGGGTFVANGSSYTTATPMIVAGGGGGVYSGASNSNSYGWLTTPVGAAPGTNGSGAPSTTCGGGGGGFYSSGGTDQEYGASNYGVGGAGFRQGGAGGVDAADGYTEGAGGFGGGAASDYYGSCNQQGGAGGGYNGGSAYNSTGLIGYGYGGGSYNGGVDQVATAGANAGNGYVTITTQGAVQVPSTSEVQWDGVAGQSYTFTLTGGANWSTPALQWWQYNGSGWVYQSEATGSITVTPTTTNGYGYGWNLVVCLNGTSCNPQGGALWPGTSATLSYKENTPVPTSAAVSSSCWVTNGSNQYTITCTGQSSSNNTWGGSDGGNQFGLMALINYQGTNAGNYGGYFAWNYTQAELTAQGYTLNQHAVTSGVGWVGQAASYGNGASNLVSGTQSWNGYVNTVTFTITPTTSFPQSNGTNAISVYCGDNCGQTSNWSNYQLNFSSSLQAAITATEAASTVCGEGTTTLTAANFVGQSWNWYTGANGTGVNLGSANPITVGGDQTYYAYATNYCSTAQSSALTVSTTTAAPSITAPAAISTYNSPNNSCAAAEAFAVPATSDATCSDASAGNFNLASTSGPLSSIAGNLKLWCMGGAGVVKDGSGNVSEWRDISGNGNKFIQPTFSQHPTRTASSSSFNGNPVLTFNTSQLMYLQNNLDGNANSSYTMFVVDRLNGGTNARLVSSQTQNWLFGDWSGQEDQFYFNGWQYGAGVSGNQEPGVDALPHMYEATSNSTAGSGTNVYDYGQLLATGTAGSPNGPGVIELNGYSNGAEISSGDVAEVIYYNAILTTAQRQIVEGYLATKYNLPCPLASLQAYQTFASTTTEGFIASDQAGNTAVTTQTASVTAYPGPSSISITNANNCAGSSTTSFSVANGMAPAGYELTTGTNSSNYLLIGSSAYVSPITQGSAWTEMAWVKFPLPANPSWNTLFRGQNQHHIIVERTQGTTNAGLVLGTYNGGFYPASNASSFNGSVIATSTALPHGVSPQALDVSTLSTGWHHIAAVGSGGSTYFYVDGVFVGRSLAQVTGDPVCAVGNYQGGGQDFGTIDEVKIYNTALPQNAISNAMTQASTSSSDPYWSNLQAYYKMDASGSVPNSAASSGASGSGPTGTIQGSATTGTTLTAYYTYNWSGPGSPSFSPAASTTSESVTLTDALVANTGTYSVYASANGCNSQTSTSGTVTISNAAPTITAPAAINNYNSPNNSCGAAEVFASPTVTAGCSAASGNFNLASSSGPLSAVAGNLKLWCKGDAGVVKDASGNVMQWLDISGAGNKFTQSGSGNRPVLTASSASFNGYPVVTFSGTSQYMTLATSLDAGANSTYTAFVVDRLNGTNYRLCSSYSTNWLLGDWGGGEENFYCNGWIYEPNSTPDALPHMYAVSSNSTTAGGTNVYDYGRLLGTGTAGSPNGPGVMQLNGYNGGTENSVGDVAEVIYYNTILTAAQRQVVEGYLAYKYNLPCPLASAQAYQTYAASTTIGFIAADQNANTASTTQTANFTAYPGPAVNIANPAVCQGSSTTVFSTSGMAPAGYALTTGTNTSNYLLVGSSAYVSNITQGSQWTEMAWAKFPLPATSSWNTLFRGQVQHHIIVERTQGTSTAAGSNQLLGTFNSGFYPCTGAGTVNGVDVAGNTSLPQCVDVSTLSAGWHHIAAVGTGGVTYFYIDGVLMGHSATQLTGDNVCAVGNYQGGNQDFGTIDEVKIYNTALPQNAISNAMTQASTSSSDPYWSNLQAYYKMDASGSVPNSAAGNGASGSGPTGTVQGSATTGSTATAYYTYTWSGSGSPTFNPAASTTAESVTLTNAQPGNTGTFTVHAAANSCNSATTTTGTVTVSATPVAPTLSSATPANGSIICAGYNSGTVTAAAGSGSGTDAYQYSINGGSTWNTYTNGAAITTTGATGSVIVQAMRTAAGGCSATAWSTICTWTVGATLVAPTLNAATPATTNVICTSYGNVSATTNAGSGGSTGAADAYQYSINGGSSWSTYTPGTNIATASATTSIIIQAERTGGSYGCSTVGWNTIATWTMSAPVVAPTLNAATPAITNVICTSYGNVSATTNAGSGGSTGAADAYQYSINGGSSWSTYTPGTNIATASATTSIIIQAERTGGTYGCSTVGWNTIATWTMAAPVVAPTINVATPATTNVICTSYGNVSATTNAGSGGSTGAADAYQYSINGGSSWSTYTPGANIATASATTSIIIQAERTGGTYGCSTAGWNTIATWTMAAPVVAPTINVATPATTNVICTSYGNVSATTHAGSGGSTGAADAYQYSINGGSSWSTYTPGTNIATASATTSIIIQAERTGGSYGCSTVGWNTIATWTMSAPVVAPTLNAATPAIANVICTSYGNVSATTNAGSGGSTGAADAYQYSINGGSSWSTYTPGTNIATASATTSIIIQAERTGGTYGCSTVGWNTIATWTMAVPVVAPTINVATPATTNVICTSYGNVSATTNAGSGGSTGATDAYQYSINGGSSWSTYTPGTNIATASATTSIIIQAERNGGSYGCSTVGWNTIATWTIAAPVAAPTLNVASPTNGSAVCTSYGNVSATTNAGSGGSTGAADAYQYSINGGSSWSTYTPGNNIATASATTSIIIQAERTGGNYGCSTVGWNTIATFTLAAPVVAPTLNVATPATTNVICTSYGNVSATTNAGSGGSTGSADAYQYSINGGSTWNTYTAGNNIATASATTSIIIQAERTGGSYGCSTVGWNTIATWTLAAPVVAPTLNVATPAGGATCTSYGNVSATINVGSGGSTGAADVYQYSINGGSTWNSYTAGNNIATAGATTSIIIQAERTGGNYGCSTVGWNTLNTWVIDPPVSNYGTITASVATTQYLCSSVTPSGTFSVTGVTGGSGNFTYQWYSQTGIQSAPSGAIPGSWTLISNATNATYAPSGTTNSISYACVVAPSGAPACVGSATWASGVLNFTVSTPTSFITGGNDSVCVVALSTNTLTASTTYTATWQWQSSTDDLTFTNISGATNSTYAAPTSATGQLYYHAIATYSGGSGCTPATSNNEYVYVASQPSVVTSPGSLAMCQGGTGYLGAVLSGGVGATYQWQVNYFAGYTNVSDNNSNAPGITYGGTGTQNPLDVISSSSSYTGTLPYKVIVSFSGTGCPASVTTSAGSATINHQVIINTQPASSTSICAGSSTSLTVAATPGFTLSYEWQYNNSGTWGDVVAGTPAGFTYTGAAAATLSIGTNNGASPAGSYGYRCIVHSTGTDCNPATSSTGTIVVNAHPATFTPTVSSNPVCISSSGGGTNIQVATSQTGVNYQLQNIAGPANVGSAVAGTGGSINLPTGSMSGSTTYQVLATNVSGGCTTTTTILDTVTAVNPDMAIGTQVTGDHFTFGIIGSPVLPVNWTNPATGGLAWTLATSNPASANSYSYYNGTGGISSASTGAYITTPTGASATTVSLISGTINTTGYTNISVQWGAQKSAGYAGTINLYYSTNNGSSWSSAVSFTDVQNNVTGNPWALVNNGVQIKLPAACNNISNLQLKWTANAAGPGVYYSINDIGIYGLPMVTNCAGTSVSVPYLNTSCSAGTYSIGTSTTTWAAYPSLATVTNATLPSSPVSITVPTPAIEGTYDVDLTVNDGAGHNSGTISFPVTTDPAMSFMSNLDNCSCNNNSAVFGNIVSVYAAGGTGSFYFYSGAVVDSLRTTIDGSGNTYAGTANHSGVKAVFWSKADGATHTYTVNDGVCSTTTTKVTQTTTPSTIPFASATGVPAQAAGNFGGGNGISGSFNNSGQGDPSISNNVNGVALTCHQTAEFGNNWVTYQVNNMTGQGSPMAGDSTNNKAVVEINNNGVNLDSVSVSLYRDANLPAIPNSATTTTACYGYVGYAMERHFMIKSTKSTGANAFQTPVGVRLYFTDAEFQDLKYWTMHVAAEATGQSAGCAYLDTVTNLNSIYVTKYTGPNEDGNYLNNTAAPTGLYRVFGKNAVVNGNSPLSAIDGQGATLTTGGNTNLHYVQMNVTEFSEFWLGGSSGGDPLPVSMLYLQAQALNNDSIQVSWATASEVNNHEFDVERSTDAQTWSTISVVAGHDNSTQEIDYAYNDLDVVPGVTYYYRLKQVDNNGNYTYTDVVQAMITGTGTFTVMNFVPNPTVGNTQLTVITTKNQQITVDFYDMLGQRIMSAVEQLVPGHNAIDFDLRKFAAGTYSAVVTSDNQLYTKKIVITR